MPMYTTSECAFEKPHMGGGKQLPESPPVGLELHEAVPCGVGKLIAVNDDMGMNGAPTPEAVTWTLTSIFTLFAVTAVIVAGLEPISVAD